jgi:DNA (cytosine-5)-methyltransferase 1
MVSLEDVASALMPTPRARDVLARQVEEVELLPTPRATRGGSGTETMYELGGVRDDSDRPQGEVVFLPTPQSSLGEAGHRGRSGKRGGELLLGGVAETLLPTPAARDEKGPHDPARQGGLDLSAATELLPTPVGDPAAGNGHARDLSGEIVLLPPPAAGSHGDGDTLENYEKRRVALAEKNGNNGAGMLVPQAVQLIDEETRRGGVTDLTADGEHVAWGKYRAAILRAQTLIGRLAPSPTRADGRGGKRRLAAPFVEWMMMLAAGWVTSVPGLSRRDHLRMLGNGVVPPQAAAASVILLGRVEARLAARRAEQGRP